MAAIMQKLLLKIRYKNPKMLARKTSIIWVRFL
jgi:hypothetical protein